MALMLRFLTGVVHALAETRSQAQKPAHKDLGHKWPKPLMLRFLTAPVHALLLQWASQGGSLLTI
ncbi:hypothetical protein Lpp41_04241 [Lacticaseibacillus paracasei subsp. paracasei Lpp41]|uniref:Uncharacterized protein n=1 Tax=Lacticaseibacillus paracasei subsp. paracasei Lpp41 TaxID=1256208 RepID=A0A829H878_LACPA|nr:hypothetical protein Lpp41_04241 [Lacticaseibacillus paracasei subsp. paracasei Lpp41]